MINVFVSEVTPRIEYAFSLVFKTILKADCKIFQDIAEYNKSDGVKINYSNQPNVEGLFLRPNSLLLEHHLQVYYPDVSEWEGVKTLFSVENSFIPFDIFAASFYLVSRFEEYLPGKRDSHQRFMARNSCAATNGFLEQPLVNIWAQKLAILLTEKYPSVKFEKTAFCYIPSIDIDNAWAFKNKGFVRIILSVFKDVLNGRWSLLRKRMAVVNRVEKDPYDNYDYLLEVLKKYKFRAVFFLLLNKKGKHDRSLSHRNLQYRNLIRRLAENGEVGIHPSYASNKNEKQLSIEIDRLKGITKKNVKRSRQHYLKMTMPTTYRRLVSQGIEADYSMGYPSRPGFRASIATPFYFFDVLKNEITELKIYPFQIMEVTLFHYRNMRTVDALKKIEKLMKETANVGGTFISLWHNESLSNRGHWKGWQDVYTEMTQIAAELRDGKNTNTAQ
ncbi:MAG: polysaccharide deacetylase family protein [Prolixibacteraceae bacterium]|jgi:peptidoglycan/xylan/chitin deacetylase (PgdA/CDA1 family)|nr:polysaccharide deacetylase family protein [Prolixibacteraceae bacterium]